MSLRIDDLESRMRREPVVALSESEWNAVAGGFEVAERHDTLVAGDLLVVRWTGGLAAVEEPGPGRRVVRRLDGLAGARNFVAGRLATYERMWDGCGCKVDYFD